MDWRDLQQWRHKFGWTQREAAVRLMITRQYYSMLENGTHPIGARIEYVVRDIERKLTGKK